MRLSVGIVVTYSQNSGQRPPVLITLPICTHANQTKTLPLDTLLSAATTRVHRLHQDARGVAAFEKVAPEAVHFAQAKRISSKDRLF
jgi:hypothetical protein